MFIYISVLSQCPDSNPLREFQDRVGCPRDKVAVILIEDITHQIFVVLHTDDQALQGEDTEEEL